MTETDRRFLHSELRARVTESTSLLSLHPLAVPDLVARLEKSGVLVRGGILEMPCGTDPISFAAQVIRTDPEAAHLFRPPEPPKPAAPAVEPTGPAAAASARARRDAAATKRLSDANAAAAKAEAKRRRGE